MIRPYGSDITVKTSYSIRKVNHLPPSGVVIGKGGGMNKYEEGRRIHVLHHESHTILNYPRYYIHQGALLLANNAQDPRDERPAAQALQHSPKVINMRYDDVLASSRHKYKMTILLKRRLFSNQIMASACVCQTQRPKKHIHRKRWGQIIQIVRCNMSTVYSSLERRYEEAHVPLHHLHQHK